MTSSSSNGSGPFRLSGKYLFLTYPQCPMAPAAAQEALARKLNNIRWAIWGQEKHQDGSLHLHALVYLDRACDFRSPTCLDLVATGTIFHGNYQVARNKQSCLDYVVKENNVYEYGAKVDELRREFEPVGRKRGTPELIMEELEAGKTLVQIRRDHPEYTGYIIGHKKSLMEFFQEQQIEDLRPLKKFVKAAVVPELSQIQDQRLCDWINLNLFKTSRPRRMKQMWITAPTRHGKTTLIQKLQECCRIYFLPSVDWYPGWSDSNYDLIVMDEYKHQKTVQFLNQLVEGAPIFLNAKNAGSWKIRNHPVMILSNLTIRENYPNVYATEPGVFDALADRFEEIVFTKPIEVDIITTENNNVINLE